MTMVKTNTSSQYSSDVESMVTLLNSGLHSFVKFVTKSTSITDATDEINYIANVLKPKADKAKYHFDQMKKSGQNLLEKVNGDFEICTKDVEQMKSVIKTMDGEFASLTEELKGKERDVTEAQKQCDTKRNNLRHAEDTLSAATKKLKDAEITQVATEAAGYTTAAVSLLFSMVFSPALFVVVAGTATGVIGSTALRDVKNDCEYSVKCARGEVSSSEKDLEDAKTYKKSTEQTLNDISCKKDKTENRLSEKQKELQKLKTIQKDIITLNKNIKILFMNVSSFHGHFKVLNHETRGGYLIGHLRNPTVTVCGSLSTLLTCHAIHKLCEPLRLNEMKQQIHQIQSAEWPKSIEYQDDDDELSLI